MKIFIKNKNLKRGRKMAQRIILNEISYHGFGAINHIPEEVKKINSKKRLYVQTKGF